MRPGTSFIYIALILVSCSSSQILEIPPSPQAPSHWDQFSTSTFLDSDCPAISGRYSEPPSVHKFSSSIGDLTSVDDWGSYFRFFPFQVADRKELEIGSVELSRQDFIIRQPNAKQFDFLFLNERSTAIVQYIFLAEEGDFRCENGYIEFPIFQSNVMIEGTSVNFQVRKRVLRDLSGALIVQWTRGPFRGNLSNLVDEFSHEFYRFQIEI